MDLMMFNGVEWRFNEGRMGFIVQVWILISSGDHQQLVLGIMGI